MSAPAPAAGLPTFVVCEDGAEYTQRFGRMLGGSFRFVRAGCYDEARALLEDAAAPVAGLLLDLDFRRTPPAQLVDEAGVRRPDGRGEEERRRLSGMQGILVLRALRAAGARLPALLFADLDDAGQIRHLEASLAPLEVVASRVGLADIARRLAALAGGAAGPAGTSR
jgi:hypothetical protein